ncbi:sensor histidine kinase [Chitinilyticum litopenaei]|uniref:sensor histidine kinase n=1 Tax=Chitinilyticum litopenaei TaxID=1121276 RepID=UPI00130D4CA5|nr:sensor histidine kinase [Chitinilyticum litopenaei]
MRFGMAGSWLALIVTGLLLFAKPLAAGEGTPALRVQTLPHTPAGIPAASAPWVEGWVRGDDERRWLRVQFVSATPQRLLLDVGVPDIEYLALYRGSGPAASRLIELHSDSPYAARPWPGRRLALPLDVAAGQHEYLLQYRVHGDTPLELQLHTPEEHARRLADGNLLTGLVIGSLLALLLLALLHYAIEQQPAYLYYAVTLLCAVLFLLQIGGFLFGWLWPNAGSWNQAAPVWLQAAIHCSHAAFTINLFDLRRRAPWLWRAYLALMAAALASAVHYQLSGSMDLLLPLALLHLPLPLLAGALALRQRLPAAGWYLAGAICLLLFVNVLFGLSVLGILSGLPTFALPQIGYLLEALCFAAALGYRMFSLQRSHARHLEARLLEAEQLAQAEADKLALQARNQRQQLELAAAGHDLSQPLAAIRLAIPALQAQAGTARISEHIEQALAYTEGLLRELIADARHGQGEHLLALEDVLIAAYQRHLSAAEAKGLRLRYVATGLQLAASPTVLARLLDNLLVNAIRYTETGGVLMGIRRQPNQILIQIWDTGSGIAPTEIQQLLQPFRQSGRLAAERHGHGLGLHIVQTLCQQSGYQFRIASRPGRGSCMSIVIPLPCS